MAWGTAAWFWDTYVPHGGDFGETIRAINGPRSATAATPFRWRAGSPTYRRIADILGVTLTGSCPADQDQGGPIAEKAMDAGADIQSFGLRLRLDHDYRGVRHRQTR